MVHNILITPRSCQEVQFKALCATRLTTLSPGPVGRLMRHLVWAGSMGQGVSFLKFIITTFALFLPCGVFAADFCSQDNPPSVEKLVCKSGITISLDAQLNAAYLHLMRVGENRSDYEAEQREWIAEVRDKCLGQECLIREYSRRTLSLLEEIAISQEINESEMTDSEAKEICHGVSELAQNWKLETALTPGFSADLLEGDKVGSEKWIITEAEQEAVRDKLFGLVFPDTIYNLRLGKRQSLTRFASFFTGGTCSSYNFYNVSQVSNPQEKDNGVDEVPDPDDEIRWATWGGGEYPGVYRRRNILVSGSVGSPKMVSWIKPNGRIRPLCLLQSVSKKRVEDLYADRGVCEAIAKNEIEKKTWSDVTDDIPIKKDNKTYKEQITSLLGFYAEQVETQLVDLDGDGAYERIAKFSHDSSGGCGSHQEWLGQIKDELDGIKVGLMNEALKEIEGSSVEIFSYGKDYYVESQGSGLSSKVFRFDNGSFDEVCDFHWSVESEIGTFFSLH